MKVAVVGATGLVGKKMLQVLDEQKFPLTHLLPVASEKSLGKKISFSGKDIQVISLEQAVEEKPTLAIFSAGASVSLMWASKFAQVGCKVIDNSSAWRMEPHIKLVVPEVNADVLTKDDYIIANPNCSTIQMVVALNPLHQKYCIKRIVVSTYQSVTGTGKKGVDQLTNERAGNHHFDKVYPHPIDLNLIPQIDVFLDNGYTKEEMKMINETRKILQVNDLRITATTVRVPVCGGHSESINVSFERAFDINEVRDILEQAPGVKVIDNPVEKLYPMPLDAAEKDDVFVGRIRRDESQDNTLNLWVVSDNLRKGAATNAVQIAQYLLHKKLL
ncbi:MAG: aspartate-semialdehyde dehydrogenase [Phycisphaerales bacterium]|nr:aspartate-semialdehyde dehydrogenase [Phycisphaerales bacterium]